MEIDKHGDTYSMTATATGLQHDARWRMVFAEASSIKHPNPGENLFAYADVHNGGWSVTKVLKAEPVPYFNLIAFGPGRNDLVHGHFCSVFAQPAKPFVGESTCHNSIDLAMVAHYRESIGTVVRWGFVGAKPGTTWTVKINATTGTAGVGVSSKQKATRKGVVLGKDIFTGQTNPRLRIQVVAAGGQRCTLRMHRVIADPTTAVSAPLRAVASPIKHPWTRAWMRSLLTTD